MTDYNFYGNGKLSLPAIEENQKPYKWEATDFLFGATDWGYEFGGNWVDGAALSDSGNFTATTEVTTDKATSLRIAYPRFWNSDYDRWENVREGDFLILVLKGWTRGSALNFVIGQSEFDNVLWNRLGSAIRTTKVGVGWPNAGNAFEDKSVLDVYYMRMPTSSPNSLNVNVGATSSSWPGAGYFRLSAQIFAYRSNNYPQEAYNYDNSGRTSSFEYLLGPTWGEHYLNEGLSAECIDFVDNSGSYPNSGQDDIDPWSIYSEGATPNTDYQYHDALVIDICAASDVSIVGGSYNVEDQFSESYPDGWFLRSTSSRSPSILFGEAPYHYDSPTNITPTTKRTPNISLGTNVDWMRKTFAIQGYNRRSIKSLKAIGVSAFTGLLRLTPYSNIYPGSASMEVYVNGALKARLSRPVQPGDDLAVTTTLEVEFLGDGAFLWNDAISIGLNVREGDEVWFETRCSRTNSLNEDNIFSFFTIEGFPMEYEIIMSTDLRDSGGHVMNIIRMSDFGTTYPVGGLTLTASDFGMNDITYMQIQGGTAYAENEGDIAVLASQQTASSYVDAITGETYWKINVFTPDPETGLPVELTDGAPLTFPEGLKPTIMVMGS